MRAERAKRLLARARAVAAIRAKVAVFAAAVPVAVVPTAVVPARRDCAR